MDRGLFRETFDKRLEALIAQKIQELQPYFFDDTLQNIFTYIQPFVRDGKRIRPYNISLWYHACGGTDPEKALQVGMAIELIHHFALAQDDIIDEGVMRHGIPAYHRHIAPFYTTPVIGDNQAMLIGDLLLARGLQVFFATNPSQEAQQQIRRLLQEVIVGEMIDVHLSKSTPLVDKAVIAAKDDLKSGQYTFKRPMMLGAYLAGRTDISDIEQLGEKLGIAFQMRDDLMDIIDIHANKTHFSDYQEGNQTAILRYALDHANPQDKAFLIANRGTVCDDDKRKRLREIFESTGALTYVKNEINAYLHECTQKIHDIQLTPESLLSIHALISFLRA